jgi:hypothetical protein
MGSKPRGCRSLFPSDTCRETVINDLRRHHAPIADRLGTLIGFDLQRTESEVLVAVMLTCLKSGIVVLPIHDAVLCAASQADKVEAVMLAAFKKLTGGASGSVSRHGPLAASRYSERS